jgi:hypothetical protein
MAGSGALWRIAAAEINHLDIITEQKTKIKLVQVKNIHLLLFKILVYECHTNSRKNKDFDNF